jgi:hypothetical protein
MVRHGTEVGGTRDPSDRAGRRYAQFFHELDAWTEYWDIYHPETQGRYYFGDGLSETGLLSVLLPRERRPRVFSAWTRMALDQATADDFVAAVRAPDVSAAVMEIDALLDRVFRAHFGRAADLEVQDNWFEAIFRFATKTLPPASERDARIPDDDPRKPTAGHHAMEGDLMWFAWALLLEAASVLAGWDDQYPRRALMLAGVAIGCPAHFAWRGHRRTRPEYIRGDATARLLHKRGLAWADDFAAAADEIHALFRIREWGDTGSSP